MKSSKSIILVSTSVISLSLILLLLNRTAIYNYIKSNSYARKVAYRVYSGRGKSTATTYHPKVKKNVVIEIDAGNVVGRYYQFYNGIGMGSFNDGFLKPVNREFFRMLAEVNNHRKLFLFANSKGIFMDEPRKGIRDDGAHVYHVDNSGKVYYYWAIVDAALDNLLKLGLKPIISLTFMPEKLASSLERKNPWNKGIISPPSDYNRWRELIFETINHLKSRYGEEEISKWYFEVWNEPDLFKWFWIPHPDKKRFPHKADFTEYCKLYDYAVAGALEACSSIKIGGPALAGDTRVFLKEFLNHCYHGKNYVTGKKGTRLDFISRHHYGEIEERILPRYQEFIQQAKKIAGESFQDLDILITETGPSTKPAPWLNTRYVAAWIAKEVAGFYHLADVMGREALPDIMCFWTKPVPPQFNQHFGLVTVLGNKWRPSPAMVVKRPAFNGYEALGYLGNERIQLTGARFGDFIHGIATRQHDSTVTVLLYHLNERDHFNTDSTIYNINLKIKNLPFSTFYLTYYKIDDNFSNGYTYWEKIGRPKTPRPKYLKELQANDDLSLFQPVSEKSVSNGEFTINLQMKSNSVDLIVLSKK